MAFSVNVILQLHTILYRYHPGPGGRWKMTQNEIVEREGAKSDLIEEAVRHRIGAFSISEIESDCSGVSAGLDQDRAAPTAWRAPNRSEGKRPRCEVGAAGLVKAK